tara:strand:+ start:430 stop:1821 length:1392 start_codon:yes stop_codon:yes gene_type:complete
MSRTYWLLKNFKISIFYSFIFFVTILPISSLYGQKLQGKFTEKPYPPNSILLYEIYGAQLRPVDTTKVNSDGIFQFKRKEYLLGYYRLASSPQNWVDVILNPEEKEVLLRFKNSIEIKQMEVIISNENKAAMEHRPLIEERFREESEVMKRLSGLAKEDEKDIRKLTSEIRELRRKRNDLTGSIQKDYKNTFFAEFSEIDRPMIGTNLESNKKQFFSSGIFETDKFIRTNLIPTKIMEYFTIYTDKSVRGIREAVDEIMFQALMDQQIYGVCLDFLVIYFDRQGPDELFYYVLDQYYNNNKADQYLSNYTKERIKLRRLAAVGAKAPEFSVADSSGAFVILSETVKKNELCLLFFWRSSCPHCIESMPEIKSVYKEYRETGLEIIGISLDEEKDDWIAALNEHNSNWLNVSDLKGWDSEAAEIYGVVQTPTFFLINQKMIIEKNNSDLNSIQSHLKSWKNKKK